MYEHNSFNTITNHELQQERRKCISMFIEKVEKKTDKKPISIVGAMINMKKYVSQYVGEIYNRFDDDEPTIDELVEFITEDIKLWHEFRIELVHHNVTTAVASREVLQRFLCKNMIRIKEEYKIKNMKRDNKKKWVTNLLKNKSDNLLERLRANKPKDVLKCRSFSGYNNSSVGMEFRSSNNNLNENFPVSRKRKAFVANFHNITLDRKKRLLESQVNTSPFLSFSQKNGFMFQRSNVKSESDDLDSTK